MAESPRAWNYDIGPLILRAMADVHIALAWILGDPIPRARGFVLHGLGQAKLELEHRKADAEGRKSGAGERAILEALERWITSQRYPFLTEVNVGSLAGLSTRAMAEAAGLLHFYNYVYQTWSACIHSTWWHVGPRNLEPCDNPLHRYHRVPVLSKPDCDASLLYLAAKYANKTLRLCEATLGVHTSCPNAFQQLSEDLGVGDIAEPDGERREPNVESPAPGN
jgi:hypothetical protein